MFYRIKPHRPKLLFNCGFSTYNQVKGHFPKNLKFLIGGFQNLRICPFIALYEVQRAFPQLTSSLFY